MALIMPGFSVQVRAGPPLLHHVTIQTTASPISMAHFNHRKTRHHSLRTGNNGVLFLWRDEFPRVPLPKLRVRMAEQLSIRSGTRKSSSLHLGTRNSRAEDAVQI